jgi:hypothetical protein
MGWLVFLTGAAVDWALLYPWYTNRLGQMWSDDSVESNGASNSFLGFLLTMPATAVKVAGVTAGCAGASRVNTAYVRLVDSEEPGVHVWKPYAVGWFLGGASTVFGYVGARRERRDLVGVGTGLGIARDLAWMIAATASVGYSASRRAMAERALSLSPLSGPNGTNGVELTLIF